MSNTRREQLKDDEVSTATQSTTTTAATNAYNVQQEQQHSVNRALDETKDNIRRATDEARKDIDNSVSKSSIFPSTSWYRPCKVSSTCPYFINEVYVQEQSNAL